MSWLRTRTERACAVLLLVAAGACVDQGDLFGPGKEPGEGAPVVRLGEGTYVLYEGDRVSLRVERLGGRAAAAEVLVVDRSRAVLWRSAPVQVADSLVGVPVTGFPARLYGDTALSLTADLQVGSARLYASDDTVPASSRDSAAVRPVRFYPGAVSAAGAGEPQAVALDPVGGRLFYSARDRARIGVLDLATGADAGGVVVPSGPVALRVRGGSLGALVAEGTELLVFDARGAPALRDRMLLPTLRLEVQTTRAPADGESPAQVDTLRAAVRPYAAGLAWGCTEPACSALVAYTSSGLSGSGTGGLGVLRQAAPGGGAALAPVLAPAFVPGVVPVDTAASRLRIFTAAAGGADSLLFDRPDRSRCAALSLGAGPFDLAPGATPVLYVAQAADLACGDGTRIVRIDHPAAGTPHLDAIAHQNQSGEDRIGAIRELRVSPDGRYVLVRSQDQVHLLDAALRLRATVNAPGVTAVAWAEGPVPDAACFAVASAGGVVLYDTETRLATTRLSVGPTRENLLAVWRSGAGVVVAAAPLNRDGLLLARVPLS